MKVLIDGKEVSVQNDVKIIYDDIPVLIDENETDTTLYVTATHEGLIHDVFPSNSDTSLASKSQTASEIVEDLTVTLWKKFLPSWISSKT